MSPENNSRSSLFGVLLVPALILGAIIIVALLVLNLSGGSQPTTAGSRDGAGRQLDADAIAKLKDQYAGAGIAIGDPQAPVTIREFGDYQCPACGAFAPTTRRVRRKLVKNGKARFVFYDFPLSMHEHAHEAALAARCAARQDKFWPYHDKLYETQRQWAEQDNARSAFLDIAVETGVNTQRLEQCMNQGATANAIEQSRAAGKAVGLRATPTLIIGDTLYSGAIGYDKIEQKVNALAGNGG